jgi:hypothetical protein
MDVEQLKAYVTELDSLADQLDVMSDNAEGDDQIDIIDLCDSIREQIDALDAEGLEDGSAELQALQPNVTAVNNQLTAAQKQINEWATALGDADTVIGILDKALELGIKLLK